MRALLVLIFLVLYWPPATILGWLLTLVTRRAAPMYVLGRFGLRGGLWLAGTRIRVEGREHLADPRNTIVMPNHISHLDVPVIFDALGLDFKVLVKQELFKLPFLAMAMRIAGLIPVDRSDRAQSREAIARAIESLQAGNCFLVFPEGTRSPSGELGPFKKGAFIAAMEAGSRIVPVALSGTRELLPKGRFTIRPGTVTVQVLPPVPAEPGMDRDRLIAEVRGRIAAALGR